MARRPWIFLLGFHALCILMLRLQTRFSTEKPFGNLATQLASRAFSFVAMPVLAASLSRASSRLSSGQLVAQSFLIGVFSSLCALMLHSLINSVLMGTALGDHTVGIDDTVDADNCAAGVVLTYAILAHHVSLLEMFLLVICEVIFNITNHVITYGLAGSADTGNTLTVLLFSVFYGLTCTKWFQLLRPNRSAARTGVAKDDELLTTAAVLAAWVLYPGLAQFWAGDAALDPVMAQQSAVNVYLALVSSVMTGFYFSRLSESPDERCCLSGALQMYSLSGGVAIGTVSNAAFWGPDAALLVGSTAAVSAWLSERYLRPALRTSWGIDDVTGVSSSLAVPALVGGLLSIAVALFYSAASLPPDGLWDVSRNTNIVFGQCVGVSLAPALGVIGGYASARAVCWLDLEAAEEGENPPPAIE
jgi:hypothetical protein